ncbi:MAG: DUF3168 domain-containing protein [Alphaproteobacteria bacterium]
MSASAWALQQAVFAALVNDAGVQAMLGDPPRIYDKPPGDAPLPYLLVGDGVEEEWGTATGEGAEHTLTLHAWSRAGGRKESREILAAVYNALHGAEIALDGFHLVNLRFLLSQVLVESDALTFHAIARYRAVVEET